MCPRRVRAGVCHPLGLVWGEPWHALTCQDLPAAPGSSPEALACIEWESIEVMLKTTSRSKCYIEFHSYCLEGEGAPGVLGGGCGADLAWLELCAPLSSPEMQRSGENTFQSCDIPGFLKLGWSSKHLPVVSSPGASSSPSLPLALYPEPQGELELSPPPRTEPPCVPYPMAAPPSPSSLRTAEPHPTRPGVPGGPAPAPQHQGRGEL